MTDQPKQPSFLEFLPASLFGIVMSLCGLSFSFGWANKLWGLPAWPKAIFEVLALAFFILLTIAYIAKWIKYPALVKAEFDHPVAISFFGTFIISLLLIPGIILPYNIALATGIWCCGAVLMFAFAWIFIRKLLDTQQQPGNAMPAWIIPIVGTLDVPIVGYRLPITGIHEICLVFFGIGLMFSIIMLTLLLSRLLFQPALPEPLQPTLLILVGPFALACSGYDSLMGQQDIVTAIFFYFDIFLLLVLFSKIILLPKCCPFRITWWAVGFPLVAITIASFRYASHRSSIAFSIIPACLLLLSTVVIVYLLCQTLYRLFSKKLLLPQPESEKATSKMASS
ncbi:MAG: SLAC1 anion channel family protein [Chitinophagaceae bacterium]